MFKKNAAIITTIILIILIFSSSGYTLDNVKQYYYNGEYEQAIDRLEEILDSFNENRDNEISEYDIYRNLAIIYLEKGEQEAALSKFQEAESFKDGYKPILENAIALFNASWYDDAEDKFISIFDEYQNSFNGDEDYLNHLYYFSGLNSMKTGDYAEAIERFQKGIYFDSSYIKYYIGIGEIAENTGDIVQAARNYEEAFIRDTSLTYLLPTIARGYEEMGDHYQAFQYWQRSIRVGIEESYARQRADELRDKYPELRPDPDVEVPEPSWRDVRPIDARETTPEVDIGLINDVNNLRFQVDSGFKIVDDEGNVILEGGDEYREWSIEQRTNRISIKRRGFLVREFQFDGDLIIKPENENGSILLYEVQYGSGYFWANQEDRQYRGEIKISKTDPHNFNVINRVNLEEYLVSVVPAEMPSSWPQEALRAQAVAARSYAMFQIGRRHTADGYDLCATVHCAVYRGINSETDRTTEAVLATAGEVGKHNGQIIDAVFSANSGGHTEASEHVWGGEREYLQGVSTVSNNEYEFPLLPAELRDFLMTSPESYSGKSPFASRNAYRWTRELQLSELIDNYDLGEIKDIEITERTPSGFVRSLEIIGENDRVSFSGDTIRSRLGGLRSNNFIINKSFASDGYLERAVLFGAGWGHGVGFDQTASAGMAAEGYNHRVIFTHFYDDVTIEEVY